MVGRELACHFFEDRTRPRTTVRLSVQTLTFYVLSYACAQRRCHTPRPPHVMFLTRPSPSLANFLRVTLPMWGKAWDRGYNTCMHMHCAAILGGHLQCKLVGRKPCDAAPISLSTTDCVYTRVHVVALYIQ